MPKLWKYIFIFLVSANILVFTAFFSLSDNKLHVVFCNVGQGDAVLVYRLNVQVLIDGGPDSSVLSCLSSHMPFWDRKIEVLIMSHAEADHFTGFIDVVKRYQVGEFLTTGIGKDTQSFKTLSAEIEKDNVSVGFIHSGEKIKIGNIAFDVLWPTVEYLARGQEKIGSQAKNVLGAMTTSSLNGYSDILRLSYGQFSALFTGDIEPPEEDFGSEYVKPVTVLKVPHHGSKNGLDEQMLKASSPKLAVISVGKKNRYGHPHEETLKLLGDKAIKLLRTDQDGEVEVVTDGQTWRSNK